MRKSEKIALVTGSSNGIGAGIARHFAANEYHVVVTYFSNRADGEKVVMGIRSKGGSAELRYLNTMSERSVKSIMKYIQTKHGKLDVLVNNAGVDWESPIEKCSFEDWQKITRTKIDGHFLCTKHAINLLKQSKNPNIVAIVSSLGEQPDPSDPSYSVGTAGAICFAKAMAVYLAKYKIRTNAIAPGQTKTNAKYWKQCATEQVWQKMANKNPLNRNTTPEDVAEAVLAVVEAKSRYLNGNLIYVNGGGHLV